MEELDVFTNQIIDLAEKKDTEGLASVLNELNISDVEELIDLYPEYGGLFLETLDINRAVNVFRILGFSKQDRILKDLSAAKVSQLINEMPPDDRTSFLSELKGDAVKHLIIMLSPSERKEALALLGYPEDSVGRLMTPDYITVRAHWTVARVLDHIRRYGKASETIDVLYIIDSEGRLIDDVRIKNVLLADLDTLVSELIDNRFIALRADDPQEEAVTVFRMNNRVALPVIDEQGIMLGIVTIDDILWVANEEYKEDMHRIGGVETLQDPYLQVSILNLVKKRAGWLIVLFIGQLLTASVIEHFEEQLAAAIMLFALVPLIMSSGGNSGSQASTLIIQAMALGEVTLSDWWKVMRREVLSGLLLGLLLGILGFIRIASWEYFVHAYGEYWMLVGIVVSLSLVGVVLWGSVSGAMLPFVMRKLGADPASSSAPFVATLVDVTGLMIYFTVASLILAGTLL